MYDIHVSKIVQSQGKVLRRLGVNLWGAPNSPVNTRKYRPGLHGKKQVRMSDYGIKLLEKQKIRTYYDMQEKQFRRFFDEAKRKPGNPANRFLAALEARLQTFVYRMKWGSMSAARQLVSHGHVLVNGKRVDIRSYLLKPSDVVTLTDAAKEMKIIKQNIETTPRKIPAYIEVVSAFEGKYIRHPELHEIPHEVQLNPQSVIELYSR